MDVAELAEAFKDHSAENQAQLMRRVQELMGQGVDVSSLFPSMVSVSQSWFLLPVVQEELDGCCRAAWEQGA